MTGNLFSVTIFFIVFRETLEAAIIVSVLLGLVEQIVRDDSHLTGKLFVHPLRDSELAEKHGDSAVPTSTESDTDSDVTDEMQIRRLIKRLRIQIFLGTGLGFLVALAIGAAFIAVWFTQASNLWSKSEELWEGIFSLIACLIILIMGITMLKLDRAKTKWRVKLLHAFSAERVKGDREGRAGRWLLFVLPFITVLREGMEAVVFVGGVALGQPAKSIPIAAIVGLLCGIVVGFIIYAFASRTTLRAFLIIMTNFILLIGAGLFSKAVGDFQENAFNNLLGADVDDAGGDGPGSFQVHGNVWHLDCCDPENTADGQGWSIFGAIFGWTNSASLGTVLSYVFYWLTAIAILVYLRFKEGRLTVFGYESAAGRRRRERAAMRERQAALDGPHEKEGSIPEHDITAGVSELPR